MEPYDEGDLGDDDRIIRRINPKQHVVLDSNSNCNRISTKAFSSSSGENAGMSVDIEKLIVEAGKVAIEWVTNPTYIGSVIISAGDVRANNLIAGYHPTPLNPYHGEVWSQSGSGRINKSQKRALHQASEWYVKIPGVSLR